MKKRKKTCKQCEKLKAETADLRGRWIKAYQLYSSLLSIKKEATWLFEGVDGMAGMGDDYIL